MSFFKTTSHEVLRARYNSLLEDVPVVGELTIETAKAAKIRIIGVEAGRTLLLDRPRVSAAAESAGITIYGIS